MTDAEYEAGYGAFRKALENALRNSHQWATTIKNDGNVAGIPKKFITAYDRAIESSRLNPEDEVVLYMEPPEEYLVDFSMEFDPGLPLNPVMYFIDGTPR